MNMHEPWTGIDLRVDLGLELKNIFMDMSQVKIKFGLNFLT